ncbi:hypothetical protein HXX76_005954 [Chlamydomonas incerta]|uniref:DUF2415 domain-containing protein n=1 Tax=Chlamydomonas incerta TaxID=51695 RepID=A0A835T4M2_CHLIN|nr:hypothetical protein HXX76_005954 [Chlamydomonas incerta]|eukprot:KAG2437296.1 hypothetical protein HXX76_005954 [Chlamydomonas incerta]
MDLSVEPMEVDRVTDPGLEVGVQTERHSPAMASSLPPQASRLVSGLAFDAAACQHQRCMTHMQREAGGAQHAPAGTATAFSAAAAAGVPCLAGAVESAGARPLGGWAAPAAGVGAGRSTGRADLGCLALGGSDGADGLNGHETDGAALVGGLAPALHGAQLQFPQAGAECVDRPCSATASMQVAVHAHLSPAAAQAPAGNAVGGAVTAVTVAADASAAADGSAYSDAGMGVGGADADAASDDSDSVFVAGPAAQPWAGAAGFADFYDAGNGGGWFERDADEDAAGGPGEGGEEHLEVGSSGGEEDMDSEQGGAAAGEDDRTRAASYRHQRHPELHLRRRPGGYHPGAAAGGASASTSGYGYAAQEPASGGGAAGPSTSGGAGPSSSRAGPAPAPHWDRSRGPAGAWQGLGSAPAAARAQQPAGAGVGRPGAGAGGGGAGALLRPPPPASRPQQVSADHWSEDEDEEPDTTAEQFYAPVNPKDIQGIPWERLQFNRSTYRDTRLRQYRNYTNLLPDDDHGAYRAELAPLCVAPRRAGTAGVPSPAAAAAAAARGGSPGAAAPACAARGPPFFSFVRNSRAVQSNIVHFQLRNLVWASSPNDVFVVHDNCVNHWNPVSRTVTEVLNLNGGHGGGGGGGGVVRGAASTRVPGLGRVQVSTLCVAGDLVAAGGFMGELVVKRLSGGAAAAAARAAAAVAVAEGGALPASGRAPVFPSLRHSPQRFTAVAVAGGGTVGSGRAGPGPGQGGAAAPARGGGGGGGGRGAGGSSVRPGFATVAGGAKPGGAAAQQPATQQSALLYAGRVTASDNGITNGLEIYSDRSAGTVVMAANNDAQLRLFAAAAGEGALRPLAHWPYEWAVNYATVRPGSSLAAVVGDDPATLITDVHNGVTVARLEGHRDFSFAAAWHPGGTLLATGNQDTTSLLWDIRNTATPLTRLAGRMGAIRSLRFSPDGRFLAMAEPADFVHVYDVAAGFLDCQEHDFFGEIAGVAFSPDSAYLFVGVSDLTYASLMQLQRQTCEW